MTKLGGRVEWVAPKGNYGFILGDNHQRYFWHITHVVGRVLMVGDRVRFDWERSARGPQAFNVTVSWARPVEARADSA
jgi:cold shock CspA family protein